ncbi:cyclodeaminase/cyclohydrolase family protein [Streptomyces sp. NPDC047002]|uniref:cyclodeaminase/cyclohydrolase family protein n=1 Tax=Streptomyces sp. NPDC047002 TaxID=3155475 RepID=UPI0034551BB5
MRDQKIGAYLDHLAARVPAPGGGAVAALHAAQAAGLLAMVARYTEGGKYAEHAATVRRALDRAERLRHEALRLAELDAEAFGGVADAYRLPHATQEEKAERSATIAAALLAAAGPPAAVIAAADELISVAEELAPVGNRNVITDVAAAADAARAAATTARVNVEVNLTGVRDVRERARLRAAADSVAALTARADGVSSAVRAMIAR